MKELPASLGGLGRAGSDPLLPRRPLFGSDVLQVRAESARVVERQPNHTVYAERRHLPCAMLREAMKQRTAQAVTVGVQEDQMLRRP